MKEPAPPPGIPEKHAEPAWSDDLWQTLLKDTTFMKLVSLSDPELNSIEKRLLRDEYDDELEFLKAWNERLRNSTMEGVECTQTLFARYPDYSPAYIKRIRADDPPQTRAGEHELDPVIVTNALHWTNMIRFLNLLHDVDLIFRTQIYPASPDIYVCDDPDEYVCMTLYHRQGLSGFYSPLLYPCDILPHARNYLAIMTGVGVSEFLTDLYNCIIRQSYYNHRGERIGPLNYTIETYGDFLEYYVMQEIMYDPRFFFDPEFASPICRRRTQNPPGGGSGGEGNPTTPDQPIPPNDSIPYASLFVFANPDSKEELEYILANLEEYTSSMALIGLLEESARGRKITLQWVQGQECVGIYTPGSNLVRLMGAYSPALVEELFHVFQDWNNLSIGRHGGDIEIEAKMMLYQFQHESSYRGINSRTFQDALEAFLLNRSQNKWDALKYTLPHEGSGYIGLSYSHSVSEFLYLIHCYNRWRQIAGVNP